MDGPRPTMLSEISQTEKDNYHMISLTCGAFKTKQTKQNSNRLIDTDTLVVARREGRWRLGETGEGD